MNINTSEQQKRISAEALAWAWCLRHEARGALILHGIEQPTEQQITAYILYGEKSLNRRTL